MAVTPKRSIRIPDDEWAEIKRLAKREDLTATSFIRMRALDDNALPVLRHEIREIGFALGEILAYQRQTGRKVGEAGFEEILRRLRMLMVAIVEKLEGFDVADLLRISSRMPRKISGGMMEMSDD